jgi:hypothetical protein
MVIATGQQSLVIKVFNSGARNFAVMPFNGDFLLASVKKVTA